MQMKDVVNFAYDIESQVSRQRLLLLETGLQIEGADGSFHSAFQVVSRRTRISCTMVSRLLRMVLGALFSGAANDEGASKLRDWVVRVR